MPSRRASSLFFLSALLLTAAVAPAQPGAPGGPPAPAREMDQLWFLQAPSTWHCAGTSYPPGGPGHPVVGDVPIRADLGGFWRSARYEETKTAENPMPIVVQEYYTYDVAKKAFLWVAFDSMGGRMQGWAPAGGGDSFVFEGEAHAGGPGAPARVRFTRRAASEMTVLLELGTPDGKWVKLVDLACKR